MIPNRLLREFFARRGELVDFDWTQIGERDADLIFQAWHRCASEQRSEAERIFRLIWDLANPRGLQTIVQEGRFWKLDLAAASGEFKKPHAKVLWVYLNHQQAFKPASRLNRADRLSKRYWRTRRDLPTKEPDTSRSARQMLANEISSYLMKHQGRGEHCQVDAYLRDNRIHYFFCYPANYVDAPLLYTESGEIKQPLQKPAFEIIFAYQGDRGILDVFVEGDKSLRGDLEEMFCRVVLGEMLPDASPRPAYNLKPLLNPRTQFPTQPEHGIVGVRVRALRLAVSAPGFGRITLEADERRKRGDVYDLLDTYLNRERLANAELFVSQVEIEVRFRADDGENRLRFTVTHPDSCSLGDAPDELTIKGYLPIWGLAAND